MPSSALPLPPPAEAPSADPLRDPSRLDALRRTGLLTAVDRGSYDRFARLAARLLDTPVALLSVVEPHRQVFASAVGLGEPWASRGETPLSHSFCQHVVRSSAPLVVGDAREDPLVADNAAVRDFQVVAYLGTPIYAPGGEVLGSLCAIDGEPRVWTDDDVALLGDLAATLADELVLAETAAELEETAARLKVQRRALAAEAEAAERLRTDLTHQRALLTTALDEAPLILFSFDADGTITVSRGSALASLGLTDGEAVGGSVWDFTEPGSEGQRALQRVLAGHTATWTSPHAGEWFETTASPTPGGGGVAVSVRVTERVQAEERAATQTHNLRRLVTAAAAQGTFEDQAGAVLCEVTDMLELGGGLLAQIGGETYTCLAGHAVEGDTMAPGDTLPLGDTYCALAMEAGDVVAIEHMAESEHCGHRCYAAVGLEAYIGVPVWVDGEAIGALSFSSSRPAGRPFTDADRELVRLAGLWAGSLLEREAREQATQAQADRVRALADAFTIPSADDVGAVSDVLDRLRGLLGLDVGIVSKIEPDEDRYEILACAGPDDLAMERGDVFALGDTYCSITVGGSGVLAINHAEASEHRRHPCHTEFGLEAYLGAPIVVDGELYGTLNFSSPTPRATPLTEADEDLVRLAARWVGGLLSMTLGAERRAAAEREAREREAELALVQRALPDALIVADAERRIRRVNPAFSQLFGYDDEDVLDEPTRRLYADPEAFEETGRSRFNTRGRERLDPYVVEYRRRDGTVFAGETVGTPVLNGDGRVVGYIGLIRDVTEREEQRRRLAESEARYRLLAENASDLVCLHTPDGAYEWASPSVESVLGYTPEEFVGLSSYDLFHPDDVDDMLDQTHEQLLNGEAAVAKLVHRFRHKAGHYVWIESHTRAVTDDGGTVLHLRTSARDVTARREMEDRLYRQAHYDALTGLANRALFTARLEAAVEAAEASFGVLFVDLDRFKAVNDTLGHSAGDRLLQEVAVRLERVVRPADTVARLGGDEFAVLLDGLRGPGHAESVAARIQEALRSPVRIDGHDCSVGASVGVTVGRPSHASADAVLREADLAMYEAKAGGRGRSATFSDAVHHETGRSLRLEVELPRAIARDELRLAYQPIVRLADGSLVGFEALVRWEHPELGLLYPDAFIGAAEDGGQIVAVDRWVLREATRQMTVWEDALQGVGRDPFLLLNVNCTGHDLLESDYADAVRRVGTDSGFDLDRLLLEITESLLVEDAGAVAAELRRLQGDGVQFCIDDFGTGYSSLSTLHTLPVDRIKVDRSFVAEMAERDESRALVDTVVRLGEILEKEVVAEGIETPAHLAALRAMGCAYGQGYLFDRPLGPEAVAELLASDRLPWHAFWTDADGGV